MHPDDTPRWRVTEGTDLAVLVALYLRGALGVRAPGQLPPLRGAPTAADADDALTAQWLAYWDMTVEPLAHPAGRPLDLVTGYDTLVALPAEASLLRAAIEPLAASARAFAAAARRRHRLEATGRAHDLAWAHAVRDEERRLGRAAHPFLLNVQILPLSQRGIWWIGDLTIAVSDGLRDDVAAFGKAIRPIVADLV